MKICQVVASSGNGGLEKHVRELCNELSKTEEVTLIASKNIQAGLNDSVRFVPVDFSRSRYNPFLLWGLFRLLRSGNYDIVHAQANKAVCLVTKLRFFLSSPIFGTIHNSKPGKGKVFKNVAHVIAVSKEAAARVNDKTPVTVIYNGIDYSSLVPGYSKKQLTDEFNLDSKKPLLCSVGRLVNAKGFDLLLDALINVDANMLIIGDGPLKSNLLTLVEKNSLQNRVRFLGYRDDIQKLLCAVDGMIISSRNEGFSYVFVEALLSKTPVLSTDVSTKEFLPNSLIMSKYVESIQKKMNEFVFQPVKWNEDMDSVFERAQHELTLEAMVENTLAVYKNVLNHS
ncbi:MAG: glycosyltransferase [Methylicorpusculum sp.]|uniref:glycosyltransferase n=1 Tax=Methylicorpusculum sp. TaxID=2713644 RepID=UPI00272914CE|nr:glycosyltransferase [Methylicorpusculum sp.]MDO8845414.1 glycosyltransferase [Methylicorpusculum sp.]MDO8940072.1 glycosyltransferase [Methylicorpusculum sp.]MDO9241832.1 glycosyltransferase [Methylicorpusculum sp.]MDP2179572.1 glycosyltransferase [Methylicorpusculum sp.]MDP2201453.1 glycosyltransferase [Methylicorpusculum sp.]